MHVKFTVMGRRSGHTEAPEIVGQFCMFLERKGLSSLTIKNYRSDLEGLVRWSKSQDKKEFSVEALTAAVLDRYRESLVQQYSAATANRKLATLRSFLRWTTGARLRRRQELPSLPYVRMVARVSARPRWLDPFEQTRLYRAVESKGLPRDIALFGLMLNTGLRVSELCLLRWDDVRIAGNKAALALHRQKGIALLPLNRDAHKALLSLGYPENRGTRQAVFMGNSGPMTRREVEILVDRYSRIAGLNRVTPRVLRHSFCMNLAALGVGEDILAGLLGHSSLEMMRVYCQPFLPQDLEHAVKRLETLSNSGIHYAQSGDMAGVPSDVATIQQQAPETDSPPSSRRKGLTGLYRGYQPLVVNLTTPFASSHRSELGNVSAIASGQLDSWVGSRESSELQSSGTTANSIQKKRARASKRV